MSNSATPWTAECQASLSITNTQSLLKLMSIKSMMSSNHLILCHPLFLLPSVFSSIRIFSNQSALRIRQPMNWSFIFNISPSNEHPGLISFRMDWLDLLAVQGTLKSFLQYHSSKASIFWSSAFFIVQLSHSYGTIGKTVALTRWTFVGKAMSLFIMLSRFVMGFPDSTDGKEFAFNVRDPGSVPGLGRTAEVGIGYPLQYSWASLVDQLVKNLLLQCSTWVASLGWEDPLEKGKATHSRILTGKFHGLYSPWGSKEPDTTEQLSLSWLIHAEVWQKATHFCKAVILQLKSK